jgi:glycosyl transferase family 2
MLAVLYVGLLGAIAIAVIAAMVRLEIVLRKYRYRPVSFDQELPTITVCIPARNEMHAMTECLERVLASDYPKLEIIVLDDSSVDDTSMLIKSFAHAGVRFVEGRPLPDGWLGKNNALQGLLNEASGHFLLFLDVDTTLKPYSIRCLVEQALARNLKLISVLPQREDGLRASVFLGTLRYFWLLMMDSPKNPAVSGAAWLVVRSKLAATGGFDPYKADTQPEIAIAKALGAQRGSQLMLSNQVLGFSYEKKWSSQVETSIRLLRPLLRSSVFAGLISLAMLVIVVVPTAGFVLSLIFWRLPGLFATSTILILTTIVSLRYFKAVWRYGWWLGALHWPYVVLQEAVLIMASIVAYARKRVTWKGRSITAATE